MGDSYREELKRKKTKSGFEDAAPGIALAARKRAERRAALRAKYARKPPVGHHQAIERQARLI